MQQIPEDEKKEQTLSSIQDIRFDGECLTIRIHSHIGRMCARLCAYMLLTSGEKEAAEVLFKNVGY